MFLLGVEVSLLLWMDTSFTRVGDGLAKGRHPKEKSSFFGISLKGGVYYRIQTFRGTFCCCWCLEIFDAGGKGVLPISKFVE